MVHFLCFFKQISYTGSTDTDKHFHEIRTGNAEKRNTCFSCNCLRKKVLPVPGGLQNNSFRNSGTYLGIFLRGFQEIYHFLIPLSLPEVLQHLVKCYFLIIWGGHSLLCFFRNSSSSHCFRRLRTSAGSSS